MNSINNEGVIIKKVRKYKKKKASQPEAESCSTVVKIEKKHKKVGTVKTEVCWSENEETKPKKKKRKLDSDSLKNTNGSLDEEDNHVSGKKKKFPDTDKNSENLEHKKGKQGEKKKVRNESKQITQEHVKLEIDDEQNISRVGKKAKKNKLVVSTNQNETEKMMKQPTLENKDAKTKRKIKNSLPVETPVTGVEEIKTKKIKNIAREETNRDGEDVKETKKKSKKMKLKIEPATMDIEEVNSNKKTKKKTKSKEEENGVDVVENQSKKKSKVKDATIIKKKKNKHPEYEILTEKKYIKVKEKRKKVETARIGDVKKRKVKEELPVIQPEVVDFQEGESDVMQVKKTKKKISAKVKQEVEAEVGAKKKKKLEKNLEDQTESSQVDVVFLSERSGNVDEFTINQERRLALQMEIDKASQPESTTESTALGQWSTSQFESSKQQQKFLRLMGGFKKSSQPMTETIGKSNMALGKQAQEELQQGLLGEFERAHSRRMDFSNKGAGIGFEAPSNKTFSIDVNARRSVFFDD